MEAVGCRIHFRSKKDRLTERLARGGSRSLGLLLCALLGALSAYGGSQSAVNRPARDLANLPALAGPLARSESLESAWAEAVASAHRLKASCQCASATRFPAAATQASHFSTTEAPPIPTSVLGLPPLSVEMDEPIWSGQVTATLPLLTSQGLLGGMTAAKVSRNAIQAQDRRETLDLKLSVADAYVRVLRATKALQAAENRVVRLASLPQTASAHPEEALAASNDLPEAQVVMANAHQRERQARLELGIARASYNRLLNRSPTNTVALEDLAPPPAGGGLEELTALAFLERPEVAALVEQAATLRKETRSMRASLMPSIGVNGGYSHLETSVADRDYIWSLGLVGTWNLFDPAIKRRRVQAADAKADAVSVLLAEEMGCVAMEVRHAWREVDETRRRLEATRDALARAESALKAALDRCRADGGAMAQARAFETLQFQSLQDHDDAVYDAVTAVFRLRHAVGDL